MKFAAITTLFLAEVALGCNWFTPVILCYPAPVCDGVGDPWPNPDGSPATIQQCSTNFGRGNLGGVAGGGGSCTCVEQAQTVCANFDSFDAATGKLSVTRRRVLPDGTIDPNPLPPIDPLQLQEPIFVGGDPHIKGWNGVWYDWHGQCDSVMLSASNFNHGAGLDIHIRSKIRYEYSFIETAAIRIGEDVLEVSGFGQYFLNGVADAETPAALSDLLVDHKQISDHDHQYNIDLGDGAHISIKTHNDIVAVGMDLAGGAAGKWFANSTGLMGSFETGALLARDGVTVLTDPNEMGQEWQVQAGEPKLFQNNDHHPQAPVQCMLPSPNAKETRRLGETDAISREAAETACSQWKTEDAKERCIYDVMAVGDLDMATVGAY